MNFRSSAMDLPLILRSHIISLIKPMASVVLASSKNTTVSMLALVLSTDSRSACWINLAMSSSVVPPWTYCNHINILITHICAYISSQAQYISTLTKQLGDIHGLLLHQKGSTVLCKAPATIQCTMVMVREKKLWLA